MKQNKRMKELKSKLEGMLRGHAAITLSLTAKGHVKASIILSNGTVHPMPIFFSGTPGDHRADKNGLHQARNLLRAQGVLPQ